MQLLTLLVVDWLRWVGISLEKNRTVHVCPPSRHCSPGNQNSSCHPLHTRPSHVVSSQAVGSAHSSSIVGAAAASFSSKTREVGRILSPMVNGPAEDSFVE